MTTPPKTREEWAQQIRELCRAQWNVGYTDNSHGYDPHKVGIDEDASQKEKSIIDSIVSLQAEVERLTADAGLSAIERQSMQSELDG